MSSDRGNPPMTDAGSSTGVLTFKHKLLPNKRQHRALEELLESQRVLYNGCLEHRIGAYRKAGKAITYDDQQAQLTELRRSRPNGNIRPWPIFSNHSALCRKTLAILFPDDTRRMQLVSTWGVMDEFAIWCAGFFDGEGSVSIPLGKRSGASGMAAMQYWLQINVTQNRRVPLELIKERFGGRIARVSQPADKKLVRPIWRWIADADVAVAFLQVIRPHLRIKGKAADIAFEFQKTMKQHQPKGVAFDRAKIIEMRSACKARMESYNRGEMEQCA